MASSRSWSQDYQVHHTLHLHPNKPLPQLQDAVRYFIYQLFLIHVFWLPTLILGSQQPPSGIRANAFAALPTLSCHSSFRSRREVLAAAPFSHTSGCSAHPLDQVMDTYTPESTRILTSTSFEGAVPAFVAVSTFHSAPDIILLFPSQHQVGWAGV